MQNLPVELRSIIHSYLDDKSRRVIRLANTEWFYIVQYSNFSFYITRNADVDPTLKRIAQYSWPISVEFKKRKIQLTNENCEDIGRLTQLTGLFAHSFADPHPFTTLTNLEYVGKRLPMETMWHFTKLKSIRLRSVEDMIKVDLERSTNLESVDFLFRDPNDTDVDPPMVLRNACRLTRLDMKAHSLKMDANNFRRFTNLKRLAVTLYRQDVNIPYLSSMESLTLRMNTVGSLSEYHRTLTELRLKCKTADLSSLATLTSLKKLRLSLQTALSSHQDLDFLTALTNLENIFLFWSRQRGSDYSQSLGFINSTKLTSLEYPGEVDLETISKFGNKLQSLVVYKIASHSTEALRLFPHLTSLDISICRRESFTIIETLTKLKELSFRVSRDQSPVTDLLRLDRLTGLKSLVFYSTFNDNDVCIDSDFEYLQLTKLWYPWSVTDEFVERIAAMTSLKDLHFYQSEKLTDGSILMLTSLTNLISLSMYADPKKLADNRMTGVTLTLLTSLQDLWFNGHSFNLVELERQMPGLKIFEL